MKGNWAVLPSYNEVTLIRAGGKPVLVSISGSVNEFDKPMFVTRFKKDRHGLVSAETAPPGADETSGTASIRTPIESTTYSLPSRFSTSTR